MVIRLLTLAPAVCCMGQMSLQGVHKVLDYSLAIVGDDAFWMELYSLRDTHHRISTGRASALDSAAIPHTAPSAHGRSNRQGIPAGPPHRTIAVLS